MHDTNGRHTSVRRKRWKESSSTTASGLRARRLEPALVGREFSREELPTISVEARFQRGAKELHNKKQESKHEALAEAVGLSRLRGARGEPWPFEAHGLIQRALVQALHL